MRKTSSTLATLPKWFARWLGLALMLLIRLYRLLVSPLFGRRCRFEPTCSVYALESIRLQGPLRGSWSAVRRVLRCHPFHPGGYDPPSRPNGPASGIR